MKDTTYYKPFNHFILRTPYLSLSEIENLTVQKIKYLLNNEDVSEAIYIASPELHQEMLKIINNDSLEVSKSLILSLAKYVIRMGARCTPFGLFILCCQ